MREYVAAKIADPARAAYVRDLFSRIAPRYDVLNRVMTGGRDRRWRAITVAETRLPRGGAALDVATGTGDVALALARGRDPDRARSRRLAAPQPCRSSRPRRAGCRGNE